jgi:protocatechuate 3,4-dioxygenase beta subunit
MSAQTKPPTTPVTTTTRRTFVGTMGAVLLGCSDDGTEPVQSTAMSSPNGSGTENGAGMASDAPGEMAPSNTETPTEPAGTAAQAGDQPAQPTNLQSDGNPGGTNPGGTNPNTNPANPNANPTPPAVQGPGSCTLYPEQTEGPYYVDGDMVRADIREGKPGTSFTLDLQVLSANGCTPIANAAVDIWHCDAGGIYSGYQGQLGGLDTRGLVFLRGTQLTGADGRVQFQTIYPGWYPGRTTHIHFKVHLPGNQEVTSQLYFEESLNTEVYGIAPYASHGQKDTSNMADAFARGAPLTPVTRSATGYAGSMTITVAG